MSWSLPTKNEDNFCTVFFARRNFFFQHLCFISLYNGLKKIQNRQTFSFQKKLLRTLFCLFLKLQIAFIASLMYVRLLSKHCKDISKYFRLISNDFLALTETHFNLSELQTDIQTTLEVLNMHFNNNEEKFLSLAYGSQKSISITQKIDYHGISKISVKKNSFSNTIFNIVTIYRSHSILLQQFSNT